MELGVQDKTAGLVVKITNQSFSFPAYRSDVKLLTAKQAEEGRSHGTGPPQLVKEALLQGVPSPELRPQARFGAQPPQGGGT